MDFRWDLMLELADKLADCRRQSMIIYFLGNIVECATRLVRRMSAALNEIPNQIIPASRFIYFLAEIIVIKLEQEERGLPHKSRNGPTKTWIRTLEYRRARRMERVCCERQRRQLFAE